MSPGGDAPPLKLDGEGAQLAGSVEGRAVLAAAAQVQADVGLQALGSPFSTCGAGKP